MSDKPHILIIGSGSVGKRHARNFCSLGACISCVDPRADRRVDLGREVSAVGMYETTASAFNEGSYDGVVVASPTACHPADALSALAARSPILLEKPVARTLQEARAIAVAAENGNTPILLGYTWRWWPPLARVKKILEEDAIGAVRHVQFHMSAHLADWHPWERYQDFFMSSAALGGGALLDESHWIDLMIWLFGIPTELIGRVEKVSNLEIDSDDTVDAVFVYRSGLRITLHLDLYGRPHEKFIRIVGEGGTILWSAEPNRIAIGRESTQAWRDEHFSCERNDMFVALAQEFLNLVGGSTLHSCTLDDGLKVMAVIEGIRASHLSRSVVRIETGA